MANKPNMKVLKDSQEKFDIELPKGDVKAAADALYEHFVEAFGEENLAQCQVCKMAGPEYDDEGMMIPTCPFCGTLFEEDEAVEEEEEPPPPPKKTKGTKKSAKKKATPAKKKKTRGRPPKEEVELVPLTPEEEEELNEQMERIKSLRKTLTQNAWQIGTELEAINKGEKWRTAFGCKSFFEFCQTKLDMSRSGAYKYMLTAREFDEDQFLELGIKRAELIASAKENVRPKLMKQAKEGATHSELKAQRNKLEGRVPHANDKKTLTLNSRVKEGDIYVPWLAEKDNEPVKRRGIKNKYAELQVSEEIEMIIMDADNELGLTINFRKIKTTGKR